MEATECGAASLGMVLAQHGRIVPLEELRVACGVSRNGSSAKNIVRASRTYDLLPHAYRREPEQLLDMALPMIIFWNFNHFLVLEGFSKGRVHLNDPATGPRTVSWDELDRSFTGIAITFDRSRQFVPGGRRPSVGAGLARRLGNAKAGLLFCVIAGLALVAPGIAVPAFLKAFIDGFFVSQRNDMVGAVVLGILLAGVVQLALAWVQQVALLRLQTKLSLRMSAETIRHLLRLPAAFFAQRAAGDLAYRASLNDQVAQLLSGQLSQALLGLLTAVLYAFLMLRYDALLTAVVVVGAACNVLVVRFASRRRKDLTARGLREQAEVTSAVSGGIALIESVKASGGEEDLFTRWSAKEAALVDANQQVDLSGLPLTVTPVFLVSVVTALVLGVGALQVMHGNITLGTLVAFQVLMGSFLSPISQVVALGGSMQQISGNLGRLDDVLRAEPVPELATAGADQAASALGTRRDRPLSGELVLRSVTFGYSPLDPPLVDGLDLHILPGHRIALVGGSGSGKSTVAKLVSGLYVPWSGDVLFDGRRRADIDRAVLADGVALVDQDIMLFEGSVRDNLSMWDESLPEEQLVEAARDAQILDELAGRQGGLSSAVSEGGHNFSGGQRQRLEIARALARNPALLVLDEATSALDPVTEEAIDLALRRRGCSCLIVAHRLSTIRDSDEIVVLDKGKVIERGTHDDLLALGGRYAELIEN